MKKIEATFRNSRLADVELAVAKAGATGLTTCQVLGRGKKTRHLKKEARPGGFKHTDLLPKTKLDLVCKDEDAEKIISAIISSVKTGKVGDGKIFISDIQDAIRISTEERGKIAI